MTVAANFLTETAAANRAGIARTTLRTGDVPRGIGLAVNSENSALQRECGAILEAMKQWQVKTPPLSPLRFFPQKLSPESWPVLSKLSPEMWPILASN